MAQTHFLLIDEVASICRVSINTVRYWLRTGRLPSIRPARRRLVERVEVERFLRSNPKDNPRTTTAPRGDKEEAP